MFSERAFQIALLISVITHGVIFFQNSNLNLNIFSQHKKEKSLEIRYLKDLPQDKVNPKPREQNKEQGTKQTAKIILQRNPPPFVDKDYIFQKNKELLAKDLGFAKPILVKPDIIAIKKKITLPAVEANKINSPSYISYYQIVREKIRRSAYQNYTRTEVGAVYITFIISADGCIKEVRIVDEKSSPSPYLREIALRSVKDASPFPDFPRELNYPQLSFNVVISFEIE